jgi:hypothetical protein
MATAQDVVTAQLAAFNASQAALDTAQDFAGVPRTSAHIADLQAQLDAANANVTTLTADKAALQGKLDAIKAARQSEEAGEVAADAARKQIDAALA